MTDIIELDDYRPHVTDKRFCEFCGYKCQSVHLLSIDGMKLECPNCNKMSLIKELGDE